MEEGEAEIQEGSLKDKDIEGGKSTFSDVTYLHTGASKSRRSVTVALSSEKDMRAALGRISAETVRAQMAFIELIYLFCPLSP